MEFIKLEILNLASLDKKGGEVIRFTEGALKESTIFSIVGPTGSGKSTLLDAICLALYNRAPRYPKAGKANSVRIRVFGNEEDKEALATTDNRNILTRGKKEGYSKLTFKANNGVLYRAEYHVKFNRIQYAPVTTKLYKITLCEGILREEEAEWTTLPQIIGLDYEQFLRTVLIAQGSFANFLTTNEAERSELLERLVGTGELYRNIAEEIKNRKEAAKEAYTKISIEHEKVSKDLLTKEKLDELLNNIAQHEQSKQAIEADLKGIEAAINWHAEDDKQNLQIASHEKLVEQAKAALEAIGNDVKRLALHDALLPAIETQRDILRIENDIASLTTDIASKTQEVATTTATITEAEALLEQLKAAATTADNKHKEMQPSINKARELRTLLQQTKNTLNERKKAKDTAIQECDKAKRAAEENQAAITQTQQLEEKQQAEHDTLIQEVEVKKTQLAQAVADATAALEDLRQQIAATDIETLQRDKSTTDALLAHITTTIDITNQFDKAQAEQVQENVKKENLTKSIVQTDSKLANINIEAMSREVETLRRSYTLMTSENWALHRTNLEVGKPCPLCGAIEHPYANGDDELEEVVVDMRQLLADKEKDLSETQTLKDELTKQKSNNEGQLKGISTRMAQLQADITSLQSRLQALYDGHPELPQTVQQLEALIPEYKDKQKQADTSIAEYNRLQKEINRLTEEKEKATKKQSDYEAASNQKIAAIEKALNETRSLLNAKTLLAPTLEETMKKNASLLEEATRNWQETTDQLNSYQTAYNNELGGQDPDQLERQLSQAKEKATQVVTEKANEIGRLKTQMGEFKGILTTKEQQKSNNTNTLSAQTDKLSQLIIDYNGKDNRIKEVTLDDIKHLTTSNDDWNTIRADKEQKTNALTSATTLLQEATKQHSEHQQTHPEQSREELATMQQEQQTLLNQQNEQLMQLNVTKSNHDNAMLQMGAKAEELELRKNELQDWDEIYSAIGTDGKDLRMIAQTYTLRFLIEHANAEIRKFNSRYELQQVKNSLGIRVIDHDRADDIRDTTSLSGGETFIVSLGLALGLSSLSTRNISFNNLFIDEGFGTLDPDTLDTVIDSLSMLQASQGKKVGVISHTNTMSERITTQIRVIKNGNTGSSHIEIYPQ